MNLSTIIKEAENSVDEKFPTMDWEDGASTKEARRMQENVKSFLTEQIKLAYKQGAKDVIEDIDLSEPSDEMDKFDHKIWENIIKQELRDKYLSRTSQEDRGV